MGDVNTVITDPSNTEQLGTWDGETGSFWHANADRFDRAVGAYHQAFLAAADIEATDAVLDIGCGTGQTTRDAARRAPAGSALGVDLSSQMIEHARQRAKEEGIRNARFEQADAQVYQFGAQAFDVAISRTGTMFFGDPIAAFTNIAHALRPTGRLTLLTWQPFSQNDWISELSGALAAGRELPVPPSDAPGPWSFGDPDTVRSVLGAAGFAEVELHGMNAGMRFGDDTDDASRFILGLLGWMLEGLDDDCRDRALEELRTTIAGQASEEGVVFDSAAWIIHARRAS
jgi:SAM-dependent methyltransferase